MSDQENLTTALAIAGVGVGAVALYLILTQKPAGAAQDVTVKVAQDAPGIVLGPASAFSFEASGFTDGLYNGEVVLEALGPAGAPILVLDLSLPNAAVIADTTRSSTNGDWYQQVQPALDASGRLTLQVRILTRATQGSATLRLRYA